MALCSQGLRGLDVSIVVIAEYFSLLFNWLGLLFEMLLFIGWLPSILPELPRLNWLLRLVPFDEKCAW